MRLQHSEGRHSQHPSDRYAHSYSVTVFRELAPAGAGLPYSLEVITVPAMAPSTNDGLFHQGFLRLPGEGVAVLHASVAGQ